MPNLIRIKDGGNSIAELRSKCKFDTHYVDIENMTVQVQEKKKDSKKPKLNEIELKVGNRTYQTSDRFWKSLAAKVGISANVFKLFTPVEVFDRVKQRKSLISNGLVRVVEDVTNNSILALSNPTKSHIDFDNYLNLADKHKGSEFRYNNGLVTSFHPLQNETVFNIGGEEYTPQIYVETPIDGFGNPNVFLTVVRHVCVNGVIGLSAAFRTEVKISKKNQEGKQASENVIEFALDRMYRTFSNDEGFDALVKRLEAARVTPISLGEAYDFMKVLNLYRSDKDMFGRHANKEMVTFKQLLGDYHSKYGVSSIRQFSPRQLSMLPTEATVYDTINYFTEIATHRVDRVKKDDMQFSRKLNATVGDLLAKESGFDLEGTDVTKFEGKEYPDFYLDTQDVQRELVTA